MSIYTPTHSHWYNVEITHTFLGREAHGIMTGSLTCNQDDVVVTFGGVMFKPEPAGYSMGAFVGGVCRALDVSQWELVKGMYARIRWNEERGMFDHIRHITRDMTYLLPTSIRVIEDSETDGKGKTQTLDVSALGDAIYVATSQDKLEGQAVVDRVVEILALDRLVSTSEEPSVD